jgi:SAM-dependent methyltransferase
MSHPSGNRHPVPTIDPLCRPWYAPEELVRGILGTFPPAPGQRVLVLGCASEETARRLADETDAEVAHVEVHRLDSSLPLETEAVNQVWCLGAMTHVDDLARLVEELARVLRGGGYVLVADHYWDGFRPPRLAAHAGQSWHAVSTRPVTSLLGRSGLTDVEILPWPDHPAIPDGHDAGRALADDLADGRLRPALVAARKP